MNLSHPHDIEEDIPDALPVTDSDLLDRMGAAGTMMMMGLGLGKRMDSSSSSGVLNSSNSLSNLSQISNNDPLVVLQSGSSFASGGLGIVNNDNGNDSGGVFHGKKNLMLMNEDEIPAAELVLDAEVPSASLVEVGVHGGGVNGGVGGGGGGGGVSIVSQRAPLSRSESFLAGGVVVTAPLAPRNPVGVLNNNGGRTMHGGAGGGGGGGVNHHHHHGGGLPESRSVGDLSRGFGGGL
jgi:hypothetical protein